MGVVIELLAPALVILAGIVLLALQHASTAISGSSKSSETSGLSGWLKAAFRVSIGALVLSNVNQVLRATVSHWALAHVKPVTKWFLGLNHLANALFVSHAKGAERTARGFERMRHVVIPREINAHIKPVATTASTAARNADAALARTKALSSSVAKTHAAQVKLNVHYTHAVDHALPRQIGGIRTREEALSRDQAKLKERTTSLENGAVRTFEWIRTHPLSAVTGVFAGAVAVALSRLGYGFFRCRAWKSLGKKVTCGMGRWLEELLGVIATFALALFSVLRPEVLAKETVDLVDLVEPILSAILSE